MSVAATPPPAMRLGPTPPGVPSPRPPRVKREYPSDPLGHAATVIDRLIRRGVRLDASPDGKGIDWTAPPGVATAADLADLRRHKRAILTVLDRADLVAFAVRHAEQAGQAERAKQAARDGGTIDAPAPAFTDFEARADARRRAALLRRGRAFGWPEANLPTRPAERLPPGRDRWRTFCRNAPAADVRSVAATLGPRIAQHVAGEDRRTP